MSRSSIAGADIRAGGSRADNIVNAGSCSIRANKGKLYPAWCQGVSLPRGESPGLWHRRFENFISFLGPAGFLIDEAALLGEWRIEEWLALMAPDARYLVPSLDMPDADHRETLFLIADDRRTLASRVRQLLSGTTWAENPRSRTRPYVGQYRHVLVRGAPVLLFRERRAILDLETLRPHGKLSFIL